jgi:tRNA pseudouridine38-40 synthase
MMRVAAKIAYLGENFSGSQIQPGFRTVGGEVLSCLSMIMKMPDEEIDLKLASRTDRGVNSLGNVAVFNSSISDPDILLKALNAVSKDVFFRNIAFVDEDFNPRFADARKYRYVLPAEGLDIAAMTDCVKLFSGEHDFIRFCKPNGKPTTLKLDAVDLLKEDDLIIMDFSARYFLWNMIRRIVAAVISVGRGDSMISDVKDALDGKDITFGIARPEALTLVDVYYKNIDFFVPSADMFDKKIEEEMFRDRLRGMFFASL